MATLGTFNRIYKSATEYTFRCKWYQIKITTRQNMMKVTVITVEWIKQFRKFYFFFIFITEIRCLYIKLKLKFFWFL